MSFIGALCSTNEILCKKTKTKKCLNFFNLEKVQALFKERKISLDAKNQIKN
jgi:hypothetical protein